MTLDWNWLVTAVVAVVTLWAVKSYLTRKAYPPGPFPLLLVGNVLSFRGKKSMNEILSGLRSRYGNVFTIWLGSKPMIFVCGWTAVKEALLTKKNDFAGRIRFDALELFLDGNSDIGFSDPSPKWDTQRKIGHAAVRKYAASDKLRETVLDLTDDAVDKMIKYDGPVQALDIFQYVILNVISSMAFGIRYKEDDREFLELKRLSESGPDLFNKSLMTEFVPILKPFMRNSDREMKALVADLMSILSKQFKSHRESYSGDVRDFTDAVLAAREEADPSEEGLKQLTDTDLFMIINNLFNAGTDTTRGTLLWAILFLCSRKDAQEKAAEEVRSIIGDSLPTQQDRTRCPYTWSVILEVLRMRNAVPFLLPHKALRKSDITGKEIPKDSVVIICMDNLHNEESYWKHPERFLPERFLDNPDVHKSHYLPFGLGRRSCIGEKMAQATTFLVLTRILQRCSFDVDGVPDLEPMPNAFICIPKPFKLLVKKRQQ